MIFILWCTFLLIVFIFLTVCIKAATLRKKRQILKSQLAGLQLGSLVKGLLSNIQQHRGMLNALLKGDNSFKFKILTIQQEIDRNLTLLQAKTSNELEYKKTITIIARDWKNLKGEATKLEIEISFAKHCTLIEKVLAVLTDVAEQNQLINEKSYAIEYVDIIWRLLPVAAESLGKARAVGCGIAASGGATAVDKINLRFLIHKIESALQMVKENLAQIPDSNQIIQDTFDKMDSQIRDFLAVIETQLLLPEKTSIQAGAFFTEASHMLNAAYGLYEQGEKMAKDSVEATIIKLESTLNLCYSGIFISGIIMPFIYYALMSY